MGVNALPVLLPLKCRPTTFLVFASNTSAPLSPLWVYLVQTACPLKATRPTPG